MTKVHFVDKMAGTEGHFDITVAATPAALLNEYLQLPGNAELGTDAFEFVRCDGYTTIFVDSWFKSKDTELLFTVNV